MKSKWHSRQVQELKPVYQAGMLMYIYMENHVYSTLAKTQKEYTSRKENMHIQAYTERTYTEKNIHVHVYFKFTLASAR